MRIEPTEKSLRQNAVPDPSKKVERITRIVAIVVAFISTFVFFFKILFF